MASKDAPVEIPEEEEDQWVGARPWNPKEVRSYHEKVDALYLKHLVNFSQMMSKMLFKRWLHHSRKSWLNTGLAWQRQM